MDQRGRPFLTYFYKKENDSKCYRFLEILGKFNADNLFENSEKDSIEEKWAVL